MIRMRGVERARSVACPRLYYVAFDKAPNSLGPSLPRLSDED